MRQVIAFRRYFLDFFHVQPEQVKAKILWTLELVETLPQIPSKFFKHVEGTRGLYEIRIEVDSNTFRVFSFFDEGNLVILGNAFQKKSRKTPRTEIEKALQILKEYYSEKK